MKKARRFKTGVFGSVFFHILLLVFLGISLSLYAASIPKVSGKVLEVSLVSGGGGKSSSGNITTAPLNIDQIKQAPTILPDDIVNKKEKIQKQIIPPTEQNESHQPEHNASKNIGPSSNNGDTNGDGGSGSGSSSGGGDGSGKGNGQGDDKGSGTPVTPPRLLSRVEPQYPSAARQNELEGTTYVRLLVGPDGSVESVEVSRSSGSEILDSSAVEAANQWSFIPAKDERSSAVRCYVSLPVTFRLR